MEEHRRFVRHEGGWTYAGADCGRASPTTFSWLRATMRRRRGGQAATPRAMWSPTTPLRKWYDGDDFVTMTNGEEFVGFGGPSAFRGASASPRRRSRPVHEGRRAHRPR